MLTEQTLDKLYTMKLTGMAVAFKEQLQQPPLTQLSFEERFGSLVDRQWTKRPKRSSKESGLGEGCWSCSLKDSAIPVSFMV